MRLFALMCALVLGAGPALAAPVPAKVVRPLLALGAPDLTPSYLTGKWDEVGPTTCKGPYYYGEYTPNGNMVYDEEPTPYHIKGNRVYYKGIDGDLIYDTLIPVDHNTMRLRVLNGAEMTTLKRCNR